MSKVIVLSDALYEQMVAAQAWHYREAYKSGKNEVIAEVWHDFGKALEAAQEGEAPDAQEEGEQ
mgnify:CR=1 FL=1